MKCTMFEGKIIGIDLSLNHFGACALDPNGEVYEFWYTYPTAKYVKDFSDPFTISAAHVPGRISRKNDKEDVWDFNVRRWKQQLKALLTKNIDGSYVAIEDYTYDTQDSNRIIQIAELTGMVTLELLKRDCHIRKIEPKSVKMFGAQNGSALKIEMLRAAESMMGEEFPKELYRETKTTFRKKKVDDLDGPATDLADSYHLAKALWLERQVKTGKLLMEDIDPYIREKLFYRVTKANPVNIMDQGYWENWND